MPEVRIVKGRKIQRNDDGTFLDLGPVSPPVNPDYEVKSATVPTQIAQAGADLQGKTIQNQANAAMAPYQVDKARADARNAQITPGQQALDQAYAKEYADWVNAGGSASVAKQLETLIGQIPKLRGSDNISGPIVGYTPRFVRRAVVPDSVDVQDNVESAVQGALRQTLGSQFTEKEGERVLKRAYDPTASEQENIQRLNRTIKELQDRAWAKSDSARYFEINGTLQGYRPSPRPRTTDAALQYGEKTLRDILKTKNFTPEQEAEAWKRFYTKPEVAKLRKKEANSDSAGWSVRKVND